MHGVREKHGDKGEKPQTSERERVMKVDIVCQLKRRLQNCIRWEGEGGIASENSISVQ